MGLTLPGHEAPPDSMAKDATRGEPGTTEERIVRTSHIQMTTIRSDLSGQVELIAHYEDW